MSRGSKTLYGFYDLEVNPNCFDFVKFAVLADLARIEARCSELHLVFVPSRGDGFRDDDQFAQENREWRMRNIMQPICALVSSCTGMTVCSTREEAISLANGASPLIFPEGYTEKNPVELFEWSEVAAVTACGKKLPSLRATGQALKFINTWIAERANGRRVISITLREMGWQKERNSRAEDWLKFARWLDSEKYIPVIIRDTDAIFLEPNPIFDEFVQFPEVALNLELRAAFYEVSYLNMMVSNGPIELCALNTKAPFLMFKVYPEAWAKDRPIGGLSEAGVPAEGHLPISGPHQRFVWEDDHFDALRSSFSAMISFLDHHKKEVEAFRELEAFPPTKIAPSVIVQLLVGSSRHRQALKILEYLNDRGELKKFLEEISASVDLTVQNDPASIHHLKSLLLTLILSRPWHTAVYVRLTKKLLADGDARNDPHYRVLLGDAHAAAGDKEEAIAFYLQALKADPNIVATNVKLGMLYEEIGALAEAEEAYCRAVSNGLQSGSLFEKLAQIVKLRGDLKESIKYSMLAATAEH